VVEGDDPRVQPPGKLTGQIAAEVELKVGMYVKIPTNMN
jgi:hypothetical protein